MGQARKTCHSLRGRIDFLNQKGETFDCDNDDFADLKALNEQPKLVHPDIIAEISRVKTKDMYDNVIGPTLIGEEENPSSYAERALRAHKNAGLDTDDQAQGVDTKKYEVIVIDNDDDGDVPGVFIKGDPIDRLSVSGEDIFPGQEMVNLDVDHFSVSRDATFPRQEIVNPNENIQSPDKGETLGREKQQIKPRTLLSPKMKGKTRGDKVTTRVGFQQIKKIVVERENKTQFLTNTLALDTVQNMF